MATEVITAIISGVITLICALLTFIATQKKARNEQIQRLEDFQKEQQKQIIQLHDDVRDEMSRLQDSYSEHLVEVKSMINEMKASYQQMQSTIELRLDALEKKQDKHNSVIERTYELERQVAVLDNREKVSENRLTDLERKEA